MRKLFLSSLGVSVLVLLIHMATGVMSARYLGPYGRGELAVANRWSGLFTMLFTIGLPGAVIYLGKQNPDKQKEYFGNYIAMGTVAGLIGLVIGETLIPHILKGKPIVIVQISQLAMLSIPFGVLADGLVGTLQTINQFTRVMMTRILSEVGTLIAIALLLLFNLYTVGSYVFINTLWSLVVFIITLYWVVKSIRPKMYVKKKYMTDLVSQGFQMYATSLVNVFGGNLDQLAISVLLTPYALGLYAVSSSVGSVFPSMIIGALGTYLWPKLMDLPLDERNNQIGELHSIMFYGSLLISMVLMVLTHALVPLIYGKKYVGAISMAEIMVFGAAMSVGYVILTNYISTRGKFYLTTIAEGIGLASGLGITLPLLHYFGGIGAAVGLLTSNVMKWLFVIVACSRLGVKFTSLFKPNIRSLEIIWTRRKQSKATA